MAKVKQRRLVVKGAFYDIECAWATDGSEPAGQFLDELKRGMWDGDPDDSERPSDEQIYDYPAILAILRKVATDGEPPHARAVNHLERGVWEFKRGNKRLSFFDTPGDGTFVEKPRILDRADGVDSEYWWFPDFDTQLRLGHCFAKQGEVALPEDVRRSVDLREEDVTHDQNA